jgi:hypothetical protein
MIKRFLLFTFNLVFLYSLLVAQNDYFSTDSLSSYGIKLIDGGAYKNSMQCEVKKGERSIIYGPDKVVEFGFSDGRVYVRKSIRIDTIERKVFLERLVRGKINLYFYKGDMGRTFFLQKDSSGLISIPKKDKENSNIIYKDIFNNYVQDCENITDALRLIKYNKSSLSKFIDQYNSCIAKPFPFISYGLSFGYSITSLVNTKITDNILKTIVFKNDNSFNIGAFIDIPILLSYFSFHPEMYYQKNTFSGHIENNDSENDIIINTSSINIPCLIRYTYPSIKFRPFINIGGNFTYNIRNNSASYSASISNEIIEISQPNTSNIYSNKQMGYSIGGGIQYKLDYRRNVFVEILNNHLFNITDNTFSNNSIQISIGLNF